MPRRRKDQAFTIEDLLRTYQQKYGPFSLTYASSIEQEYVTERIPTGLEKVDYLLGGGIARSVITELFGPPSSGKTWLCYHAVAGAQRAGLSCAFVDVEKSYSPGFARLCGVDPDKLLLGVPAFGEEALDLVVDLVRSGVDLVVLDSVASLVSREDLEKQVEIGGYAPGVRLLNVGLAKIRSILGPGHPTAVIMTNQVRDNLGVLYGPKLTTPMGWRLRHDAAIRLEMRRSEWLKKGDRRVGQVSILRVEKTKVDGTLPVGSEVSVDIMFPEQQSAD